MIFCGGMPASERALEFAARHHVGAGAETGERLDHRLVGIRFHGVADERPDIGESAGEHLVMARQRRSRIAVERGPHRGRETVERDVFGMENAAAIVEVIHTCRNRC